MQEVADYTLIREGKRIVKRMAGRETSLKRKTPMLCHLRVDIANIQAQIESLMAK
jgi:hypothetical protein